MVVLWRCLSACSPTKVYKNHLLLLCADKGDHRIQDNMHISLFILLSISPTEPLIATFPHCNITSNSKFFFVSSILLTVNTYMYACVGGLQSDASTTMCTIIQKSSATHGADGTTEEYLFSPSLPHKLTNRVYRTSVVL